MRESFEFGADFCSAYLVASHDGKKHKICPVATMPRGGQFEYVGSSLDFT